MSSTKFNNDYKHNFKNKKLNLKITIKFFSISCICFFKSHCKPIILIFNKKN